MQATRILSVELQLDDKTVAFRAERNGNHQNFIIPFAEARGSKSWQEDDDVIETWVGRNMPILQRAATIYLRVPAEMGPIILTRADLDPI